jgi:hypothetical protein
LVRLALDLVDDHRRPAAVAFPAVEDGSLSNRPAVWGGPPRTHSVNPAGAAKIAQVLRHWGYRVRVASGCTDVGHLDGPA